MIKCRRRQATGPQKFKKIVNGRFFVFCWWKRKQWKRKRLKNNRFHIPAMNEALSDKDKIDDNYYSHNDVATWPELLNQNMTVEMIKLGPEKFQNKKQPFKPLE